MNNLYARLSALAVGWEAAAEQNPYSDFGLAAEALRNVLDHRPVSVGGWTCDVCGRQVNGQTDADGWPLQQGDSVRHTEGI